MDYSVVIHCLRGWRLPGSRSDRKANGMQNDSCQIPGNAWAYCCADSSPGQAGLHLDACGAKPVEVGVGSGGRVGGGGWVGGGGGGGGWGVGGWVVVVVWRWLEGGGGPWPSSQACEPTVLTYNGHIAPADSKAESFRTFWQRNRNLKSVGLCVLRSGCPRPSNQLSACGIVLPTLRHLGFHSSNFQVSRQFEQQEVPGTQNTFCEPAVVCSARPDRPSTSSIPPAPVSGERTTKYKPHSLWTDPSIANQSAYMLYAVSQLFV